MKKAFRLFGIVVIAAMVGFTFAACEGPTGPQGERGEPGDKGVPGGEGPALEFVVDIDVDYAALSLIRGQTATLTATVGPDYAVVQTVLWELYGDASGDVISLSRNRAGARLAQLTGDSVVVTPLRGGEAGILVTALGSGDTPRQTKVTVLVDDLGWRLASLNVEEQPYEGFVVETVTSDESFRPMHLYFGGEDVTITLTSRQGQSDTLTLDGPGAMFTVGNGVTLILKDITLRGIAANHGGALVVAGAGGTLIMDAGAVVRGNTNTDNANPANQGGGVRVAAGGTFNMLAGSIITDNEAFYGGGVAVDGTFSMHDGSIIGNTARSGGGGLFNGGTFTMYGGLVTENIARSDGGGVDNDATFTMLGGFIMENVAVRDGGGIVNWGTFVMDGGTISSNVAGRAGGGMANYSAFRFVNGIIHGVDVPAYANTTASDEFQSFATAAVGTTPWHGTFNGTFTTRGTLPSTSLTVEVENGELQNPLTAQGMILTEIDAAYLNTEVRVFMRNPGLVAWTRIFLSPDGTTTASAVIVDDTDMTVMWWPVANIPVANWDIRLEFWNPGIGGTRIQYYEGTAIDLGLGITAVEFGEFLPPPPRVASITITDIPAYLQGSGEVGLFEADLATGEPVRNIGWVWPTIASSITFTPPAAFFMEPGSWDLAFAFFLPGNVSVNPDALYVATVTLGDGANNVSFSEFHPLFSLPPEGVASITIEGIPSQYHYAIDVALLEVLNLATLDHIVIDYTYPGPVGGSVTFTPSSFMEPGEWDLALAFFTTQTAFNLNQPNSVYVPMPPQTITLTAGANTIQFGSFNFSLPLPWSFSENVAPFELMPLDRTRAVEGFSPREESGVPSFRRDRLMPSEESGVLFPEADGVMPLEEFRAPLSRRAFQ